MLEGTLGEDQNAFSYVYRPPFKGISWKFIIVSQFKFATN